MSKRNADTQARWVRMLIYKNDKQRCRWCHATVRFKDSMVVAHGIAFADAPTLDTIDNWFTSCEDCNKVGKNSFPPGPIPLEEASVPQLQETNKLLKKLVTHFTPPAPEAPQFKPEVCQAFGHAGCERVGCQIPNCENYIHFAYSEANVYGKRGGKVVSEYDPFKEFERER
jgi:hypothetical protein